MISGFSSIHLTYDTFMPNSDMCKLMLCRSGNAYLLFLLYFAWLFSHAAAH